MTRQRTLRAEADGRPRRRWWLSALVAVITLVVGVNASATWADDKNTLLFSKAKIRIEFNSTANDVGMQIELDGEPWRRVKGYRPDGTQILDISSRSSLRIQGITELFFESSEPSLAEVPLEEFLARFPEGTYEFKGKTVDGVPIKGEAILTHVIPTGPKIVSPDQSGASPPIVDPSNAVFTWEPVTTTIGGSTEITIVGYQLIVQQLEPLRTFSADLPAAVTSFKVPAEFFVQRNTLHKFEVLAIEASGNQTITEGSLTTAP